MSVDVVRKSSSCCGMPRITAMRRSGVGINDMG